MAVFKHARKWSLCGAQVFEKVFKILNNEIQVKFYFNDGDFVSAGDKVAVIRVQQRQF